MLFSDLNNIVEGDINISLDGEVRRFSTDTRTLFGSSDEVFIASRGKRDGHDFIQSAVDKGVKNFIVERSEVIDGCNVLLVKDSIAAFQKIASSHRSQFHIPVIGITGSNGKTTVKEWLSAILSKNHYVVKNPKSFNSQIGVPISVMEMMENHEIGVFEAGISTTNEMENLEKIIQPTVGIFTTLGQAHNEGFESEEKKLLEKLKLFANCEKLICRSDQSYFSTIKEEFRKKLVTWSLDDSGEYKVDWKGGIVVDSHDFKVDFTNASDLENLTHAIVASMEFGIDKETIQSSLKSLRSVPMRLELKKGINGCYVLDDTYNNDLAGLKAALDYLESHQENEKRTLILSDILQSGKSDQELYTSVSKLLEERGVDRLIGVGPRISSFDSFKIDTELYNSTDQLINHLPEFQNEMILVKGARDFQLERVVNLLEEKRHGTVLEVNFEALHHNLTQYRNLLSSETKLMVMVKANAYGSGILEVANFLQHQRVDQLGVAYVDEAIELRKNGIHLPIMIMNPHIESFAEFERYNFEAEIFSIGHLKRLIKDSKGDLKIHIKIDTGMHRLGFSAEELPDLIELLNQNPRIKVQGIFTHFSSSDDPLNDEFTKHQATDFDEAYSNLSNELGYQPIKHACNSPAMVRWPEYHFDMVRLGIGLHGFDPTGKLALRATSRLKTTISQIQEIRKDETIGYARKGIMKRDGKIAVLPIGYEDGYLRIFGNGNASVVINGSNCPTIGNICMDMTMVDVTDIDVKEGDEVIVFGDHPKIHQLAKWANTIPYEILTNVSSRVKRVFVSE